jgi:hypothetical protein
MIERGECPIYEVLYMTEIILCVGVATSDRFTSVTRASISTWFTRRTAAWRLRQLQESYILAFDE